jgi:lysophospholipase L1-like esterase
MKSISSLFLFLASCAAAQSAFYLRDNDTVVFYGDSITDQRMYTVAVETFAVTRFPAKNIRFVHSGWGGDRVTGGGGGPIEQRLKRDVVAYKPTVMTIMLGMNDGRYRAFDQEIFKTYSEGYQRILDLLKADNPNLRLTLIQPSPYDDVTRAPVFEPGYNQTLLRYSEFVKELAGRNNQAVADLNTGVVEMLRRANTTDPAAAKQIIPDRVHPGWAGHFIMAAELLKAWGASKLVTSVELDLAAKKVTSQENTTVSGLRSDSGVFSWTQKDEALPMPLPDKSPTTMLAVNSSDFFERLNSQWLKVNGLDAAKKWSLRINGIRVGEFSAQELAAGMNLAKLDTPMMQQAEQVHTLTVKRTNVHNLRWRQLQLAFEKDGFPRLASILTQLDALDDELGARQRANAKPGAFYYELAASN